MSVAGLETLDHSIRLTREWVNELDEAPGRQNRHRSYRLLRAVLQALRDCLPQPRAGRERAPRRGI